MTQVRRVEAQVLEKTKSDFLGSISHEMRSPLHGTLASLELLTGTKCSDQQMDLVESARSSGLQLLETIDQILRYSKISSTGMEEEQSSSFSSSRRESYNSGPDNGEDKSDRTADVELVVLCEEVDEQVAERMHPPGPSYVTKTSSVASPSRRQSSLLPSPGTGRSDMTNNGERSTIMFDTDAHGSCPLQSTSDIRIICENLRTNAAKFTGSGGIDRMSLNLSDTEIVLEFTDSGEGTPRDYVQNNLYVPFAQENPLNQHTVNNLHGDIRVKTDVDVGTTMTVTVPRLRVAIQKPGQAQDESALFITPAGSATTGLSDPPSLSARLLVPRRWRNNQDRRAERCVENLLASLERNMNGLAQVDVGAWQDGERIPDLCFVFSRNVQDLRRACGDAWQSVKMIVICSVGAALGGLQDGDHVVWDEEALIFGPVTPSKLRHALLKVHLQVEGASQVALSVSPGADRGAEYFPITISQKAKRPTLDAVGHGNSFAGVHRSRLKEVSEQKLPDTIGDYTLFPQPIKENGQQNQENEPKMFLVDDNAINLKVLGMYASKCVSTPYVSAPGGQEAIDAFRHAFDSPNAFDIIFMDLSMPQVSGLDATIAIRTMETTAAVSRRSYIVALTSLVSSKDRSAAWNAGVDEYITKPVKIKDIREVIDRYTELRNEAR